MKTTTVRHMTEVASFTLAAGFVALAVSPSAHAAEAKRNGRVHLTKNCIDWHGAAGEHCTITASDIDQIAIGSKIFYDQAAGDPAGLLDSNVVLDAGSGSRAVGRCTLDFGTGIGLCTFSDGTGRLSGFEARLDVTCGSGNNCTVDGSYRFNPQSDQ